jgi:hypothetical protein
MKLKYYQIGSVIQYGHTSLKVIPQDYNIPSCNGCFFSNHNQEKRHTKTSCYVHGIACTAHMRRDKKHIILVEEQ